jgi:hypothetical protein
LSSIINIKCIFQLYDLYIGEVGEQDGSADACPDEDVFCGGNTIVGSHCVNGKCVSNLVGQISVGVIFKCICDPGWKGQLCNTSKYFSLSNPGEVIPHGVEHLCTKKCGRRGRFFAGQCRSK